MPQSVLEKTNSIQLYPLLARASPVSILCCLVAIHIRSFPEYAPPSSVLAQEPNTIVFSAAISACGMEPNSVTFAATVSACEDDLITSMIKARSWACDAVPIIHTINSSISVSEGNSDTVILSAAISHSQ